MALSVVILVGKKGVAKVWIDKLFKQARRLKDGNGFVEGVDVGEFYILCLQSGHCKIIHFVQVYLSSMDFSSDGRRCIYFISAHLYVPFFVHSHPNTLSRPIN